VDFGCLAFPHLSLKRFPRFVFRQLDSILPQIAGVLAVSHLSLKHFSRFFRCASRYAADGSVMVVLDIQLADEFTHDRGCRPGVAETSNSQP
jgi:hypothetical protein